MLLLSFVLAANCRSPSFHAPSSLWPTSRHLPGLEHTATADAIDGHLIDDKDYFIEMVSTKARALDVKVFQGFSISAAEYISQQRVIGNEISEIMAIDHLMKNYNDNGHYVMKSDNNLVQNKPEDYFIALYNGTDAVYDVSMARQNGIVGLVRTQLRRQPPIAVGPSSDGTPSISVLSLTIPIPSSHLYLSNMRVGDNMKRRGIGMALLSSIKDYVSTLGEHESIPLVLSVDNDNLGAIGLYEKFGFEYLEKNSDWGTMILI
jgi:ribosomal protein S18 acetylase RimI-like enzyme